MMKENEMLRRMSAFMWFPRFSNRIDSGCTGAFPESQKKESREKVSEDPATDYGLQRTNFPVPNAGIGFSMLKNTLIMETRLFRTILQVRSEYRYMFFAAVIRDLF